MNYIEILNLIDYPTEVLVIDFETYFDQHYSLMKMSTIEYIRHRMFEFTGMGFQFLNSPVFKNDSEPVFYGGEKAICNAIKKIQNSHGLNFDAVTVVVKNAKYCITLLSFQSFYNHTSPINTTLLHLCFLYKSLQKGK